MYKFLFKGSNFLQKIQVHLIDKKRTQKEVKYMITTSGFKVFYVFLWCPNAMIQERYRIGPNLFDFFYIGLTE